MVKINLHNYIYAVGLNVITIIEINPAQDSGSIMCKLTYSSTGLHCVLCNTTANTGTVDESVKGCNHQTLPIRLNNTERITVTDKYCVIVINVTDMTVVGNAMCENFTDEVGNITGAYTCTSLLLLKVT